MSAIRQALGLVLFIAVCFAVAGIGSVFTTPSITTWYAELRKPSWTPPGWVFGPVWTVLYMSMAIAAWLVWRRAGVAHVSAPLAIFFMQLALNLAWSFIFFGRRNIGLATADILLLWLAILATILAFRQVSHLAGWLLAPYLVWVTYAAALNLTIWRMNA